MPAFAAGANLLQVVGNDLPPRLRDIGGRHVRRLGVVEGNVTALDGTTDDAALIDLSPIADDIHGAVMALRLGSPDVALVFISGSVVGLPDSLDARQVRWVRKPFEVGEIIAALCETRSVSAAAASGTGNRL